LLLPHPPQAIPMYEDDEDDEDDDEDDEDNKPVWPQGL
jgi:hypothetical protein